MQTRTVTINRIFALLIISLLSVSIPAHLSAQGFYGGGGFGGGGFGGYGGGGFGGYGGGAQGPGVVTVKYGEKVFDAVFGDLIDYKVYFIQVPADTIGVHYFDDGTNGDEVPYDGMPSNIAINRDTYLGPFSIKYKKNLQKAVEMAERMDALKFYDLNVATEDTKSPVTQLSTYREQLDTVLQGLRTALAQFEGYNDETYIKNIDPALFESLEGFGGLAGGGFGGGGILPDLPPPPGLPTPNLRGGLPGQEGQPGIDTTVPAAPGSPEAAAGQPQESGRFDPIGRAAGAAGMAGGALQAQEAMNALSP